MNASEFSSKGLINLSWGGNLTAIGGTGDQNVTNRKNIFGTYFEPMSGEIQTAYQNPLILLMSYRIEF